MALTRKEEVEALADALGASADAIHDRILEAMEKKEINRAQAQSLFQDETSLRTKTNALYLESVKLTVKDLEIPQAELVSVIKDVSAEIKRIETISAFIDLVADLLVLAAAAYAAKPGPIVAAFNEVRKDLVDIAEA